MEIPRPDGPDVDIGGQMLAIVWALYAISLIIVILRVYTQVIVTKQFGNGDIIMIIATVIGYIQAILLTISRHYGLGRHFFYLDPYEKMMASKFLFVSEPFAIMTSTFGRVSFMILMLRIFGTTKPRRMFLYSMMAQTLIVNLFTSITIFTQCQNPASLWDPVGTPSACWSPDVQVITGYVQGVFNSATDLIFTIMPTSIFWTLQMALRIKLGLVALLGLSVFAFVASVIKTVKLGALGERADYTYNTVNFMIWVVIENTFVLIAASIPLLRPLFSGKVSGSSRSTYVNSSSGAYELGSRAGTKGDLGHVSGNGQVRSKIRSTHGQRTMGVKTGDGDSEEGILPMGGIKKEMTVQVDFGDGSESLRERERRERGKWDR